LRRGEKKRIIQLMFGVKKYARGAAENSRPYFEKAVGSEDDPMMMMRSDRQRREGRVTETKFETNRLSVIMSESQRAKPAKLSPSKDCVAGPTAVLRHGSILLCCERF
jgi:hypothetical protein